MRHNVFVSYHHSNDQQYRNKFEQLFSNQYDIIISKSVQIGDINENLPTETIRQKIRDEYLRDSTVTVVLIGSETWKRKHVDWEIGSSLRQTQYNSRSGLIGILLPSYHDYYNIKYGEFNHNTIPPRLSDNIKNEFAGLYDWSDNPYDVQRWIHEAFKRRNKIIPDNSFPSFVNNRSGNRWQQ
jgi:hypothetical protein